MVDMAAIAGAATSLKTAIDISKIALGLRDESLIRTKVLEMQGEISSALASAIAAQTDQLAILQRISDLEKEITQLKAWDAEKENYDLKPIARGTRSGHGYLYAETRGTRLRTAALALRTMFRE